MQEITVGKFYKHYKGNLYKIIALGKHSENLEEMIVYQSKTVKFGFAQKACGTKSSITMVHYVLLCKINHLYNFLIHKIY